MKQSRLDLARKLTDSHHKNGNTNLYHIYVFSFHLLLIRYILQYIEVDVDEDVDVGCYRKKQ